MKAVLWWAKLIVKWAKASYSLSRYLGYSFLWCLTPIEHTLKKWSKKTSEGACLLKLERMKEYDSINDMSCFCFLRICLKFLKSFLGSSYYSNSLMILISDTSTNFSRYFQSWSSPMKVIMAFEKIPTALIVDISNTFMWFGSSSISWNFPWIYRKTSLCASTSTVRPSLINCITYPRSSLAPSLTSIFSLTQSSIKDITLHSIRLT